MLYKLLLLYLGTNSKKLTIFPKILLKQRLWVQSQLGETQYTNAPEAIMSSLSEDSQWLDQLQSQPAQGSACFHNYFITVSAVSRVGKKQKLQIPLQADSINVSCKRKQLFKVYPTSIDTFVIKGCFSEDSLYQCPEQAKISQSES